MPDIVIQRISGPSSKAMRDVQRDGENMKSRLA